MNSVYIYSFKLFFSAGLIVLVSEIAKRNPIWGGILASLPLISILALSILYWDTKSVDAVTELSYSIFWLVLPSLTLFITLPLLLKKQVSFFPALFMACSLTVIAYVVTLAVMKGHGYERFSGK
jgi:hypothetical protein